MIRTIQFSVGLLLFIAVEFLRIYFIMPLPGSQQSETIELAYFLHQNIFWFRTIALLILVFPAIQFYMYGSAVTKWYVTIALGIGLYFFMMGNYKMQADKMFYQPKKLTFTSGSKTEVKPGQLVLGVNINGEAAAYPIEFIAYHHQVRDTVGNEPVMITYCSVCRTGRVYKPLVNGVAESFRLVGMDHFNAMFEDATTGSWWRQVNGEAIAGPLKGNVLTEIPSQQLTLRAWLDQYPFSRVMAGDTSFKMEYDQLALYDEGRAESDLERKDSLSWKDKSWVVGVRINEKAKAFDWNFLLQQKVINDQVGGVPVLVAIEADSLSYHVWSRDTLTFQLMGDSLKDTNTGSTWNWKGEATSGSLKGKALNNIQSYQEFWHSWKTFNQQTEKYPAEN